MIARQWRRGFAGLMLLAFAACVPPSPSGPAYPARDEARATVLLVAEGVRVADEVCADVGKRAEGAANRDDVAHALDVVRRCTAIARDARDALVVAQTALDAWDEAAQGRFGCAMQRALDAIAGLENVLDSEGVDIPAPTTDALRRLRILVSYTLPNCGSPIDAGGQ